MRGLSTLILACLSLGTPGSPGAYWADICVFGGTSAGVAAAVAAAREGKSVVLIEPTNYLGGMSASGISLIDRGDIRTIGGISREFYERAGKHYGEDISWRIEPHVATRVFEQMIAEEPLITVLRGVELENARVDDATIQSLALDNGVVVNAKVFIDASYEGDLLAAAGVPFTIGREWREQYNEPLAGTRTQTTKHQFTLPVSPYIRKNDPTSGLLPGVSAEPMGAEGEGDASLPSFTYRLCLTKSVDRIPFSKPESYDPLNYELLARHVIARKAAGLTTRLQDFMVLDWLPNGKFDLNNNGPASINLIGASKNYIQSSPEEREAIARRHREFIEGMFLFLQTDPRLPQALRKQAKAFGLAADEYVENGNWPPLLYVREARRMISGYVITQADCEGETLPSTSVGLASYMIDSHNCRRVVVNGYARNEGDIQYKLPGPFAIPYESITPKIEHCRNLLVPVCLSATHVAFSSIRMEPVLMILGHSAGVAASIAVDEDESVQVIDRDRLTRNLEAQGQVLLANP